MRSSLDEHATLIPYETHPIEKGSIEETSRRLWETIRLANLNGGGREAPQSFEEHGKKLFELLFSPTVVRL